MKRLLALALLASTAHAQLRDSDRQEFVFLNRARNGGGERGLVGWVGTGVSPAIVTGSQRSGSNAISWNSTASTQTLNSESVAIPPGFGGCLAEVYYTGAGTANIDAYVEDTSNNKLSGTVVISTAVTALEYQQVQLSFPCPTSSTSVRLELLSAGDAAAIVVDDVYIGRDHRVGATAPSQVIVSAKRITTDQSVITANDTQVIFNSEDLDAYGEYDPTTGLFTAKIAGELLVSSALSGSNLTNGNAFIAYVFKNGSSVCGAVSNIPATAYDVQQPACRVSVAVGDTVAIYVDDGADASYLIDSGTGTYLTISRFPSQSQIVQRADAPGNFSTAYTPTFTGMGTVTVQSFKYQCLAPDLVHIQGRWTVATTTGTEARISLPSGMTAASTYSTVELVGPVVRSASSAAFFGNYALIEPSVAYLTFGVQTSTGNGITKATGSDAFSTANVASLEATVRLASGSGCGNVPRAFVAGSVYFGRPSIVKQGQLTVNCKAASALTSNPDGMWSAVGNVSGGACAVTLTTGYFSAAPSCWNNVDARAGTTPVITDIVVTSATAISIDCATDAAAACTDYTATIQCVGAP